MRKLKLLFAALALLVGGVGSANAQTDVTASYIGDLDWVAGTNGEAYGHQESNGTGWWNSQTTGLTGWHAFVKNGDAYESWTGSFGGAGVMMGRTMVLPEGNYTLSFKAFGCNATNSVEPSALPSAGDVVAFMTGEDNIDITNTTSGGNTFHNVSFTFDVTTANTAYEFGIKKLTDESKIDWCMIKDVTLTLNSTNITPIANNSIETFTYSLAGEDSKDTWHTNTWSTEGQGDGTRFQVPFHELWKSSGGQLLDATITGTYTPMANGIYKVSAWVRAMNEAGGDISGVKIFVGDVESDACAGSSVRDGKGRLGTFTAMADGVSGTPFNYGFKIKDATLNWLSFKNVTITYYAEMPEAEKTALLALVPTGKMNATVQSTLDGYKTAFQSNASVANYNALSLYIPTAQASVEVYTAINTAISDYATKATALDATGAAAYNASAIQTKYNNGTYTNLAEAVSELDAAFATATKAQTTAGSDWSGAIINHSFENGDFTSWTNNGMAIQSNSSFEKDGSFYAESWQPNGTKSITQTITGLASGVFRLSAKIKARSVTSAKLYVGTTEKTVAIEDAVNTYTVEFVSDGSDVTIGFEGVGDGTSNSWLCIDNFTLTFDGAKATDEQKTALAAAITAAEAKTLGFENGEYAPYTNVAALEALAAAKAINTETASGSAVTAATSALTGATWTANATDVECVYNGNFAEGQGSPAANIQQYGWTRTNGWGQFENDGFGSTTAYYNQPGSMQYGNAGVYTMPLKAQTIYRLQFKYAKWNGDYAPTVSVLNGEDGMAAQTFGNASSKYTDGYNSVDMIFVTATAGNYVLSLSASSNYVITGVSITKAASQVLEFTDGSVPSYAPGTYPTVKITRTLTANRWATAVYPFAVSGVDNIATLTSYDKSTGALGFTTAATSTANVPFLMRSTAGASEISLNNVAVAAAAATDATASEASLKGVYAATTVDNTAKNYVLSNNVIYPIGANSATVNPYRAYIQIAQDADPARGLTFTVDGETTAIDGITAGENAEDGALYNLQGQRVVKAQKGLYIKDGRKVMVK